MPVRKFRSVEEMTPPVETRPLDPQNLRRALELSAACIGLDPRRPTPGVLKFRSIEEANAARLRWEMLGR